MSTQATDARASRLTFAGMLRAEWIKLTSLRSTGYSLLVLVVVNVALGLLLAATYNYQPRTPTGQPIPIDFETARSAALTVCTAGLLFGQLVAAVLGAIAITGEYSTGMIKSTLVAVPRRLLALWAKVIVVFVTMFCAGLGTVVLTYAATYWLREDRDLSVAIFDPQFAFALVGSALYVALVAVFALGLGSIIRSSAGGIAVALGVLLVLPVLVQIYSGFADWAVRLQRFVFSNAGQAMYTPPQTLPPGVESHQLAPGSATVVVLAWVAVSLALGGVALSRRDA